MVLIKLKADENARSRMIEIANIFRAKIIEVTPETMTVELTGDPNKVQGFMELLKPFEISGVYTVWRDGHRKGDIIPLSRQLRIDNL